MPHAFHSRTSDEVIRAFEKLVSERDDIAAFLSEPVWTNAGAIVPPPDFYPAIERICRKHGILLIMDEVAAGMGRCGTFYASERWGITPDIICLGKGITGGYATLGATLVTEKIYRCCLASRMPHYSTFGWLPQDLAAARANVEVILRDELWKNAETIGAELLAMLKPLEALPFVGEVRGVGLVLGIEIVKNKASKKADFVKAFVLQNACARRGLLLEMAGNTLFITPPLILTKKQAKEGAEIITRALTGK